MCLRTVNDIKMAARRAGEDIIDLEMGSVVFSKFLIRNAGVAVSPGHGFDEYGDEYVRFALIENNLLINQAIRGLRKVM
jgi:alanine-synthesizing transaminase